MISELREEFLKYLESRVQVKEPRNLYDPIDYILKLGGKRMRPILTLMSTDLFGTDFGFLIVDLFPYAFNKQDTTINYQDHFKPSDFVNLFSHTYSWYLKPRLEAINIISGNRIGVALRYKRHMVLNRKLGNALREVGFVIANNDIGCVASSNIPLDQSALENAIMKSIRGPG